MPSIHSQSLVEMLEGRVFLSADLYEPDNAPKQAALLRSGRAQAHVMEAGGTDWMTFTLVRESEVQIGVTGTGTQLGLYGAGAKKALSGGKSSAIHRTLPAGKYFVRAEGTTPQAAGNYRVDFTVSRPADGENEQWAVLVGAWDYPGRFDDLPECKADATAMRKMLIDSWGFESSRIQSLVGGGRVVNRASLDKAWAWLRKVADADDSILFYYSGHGDQGTSLHRDDNESLDLPSDEFYTESRMRGQVARLNPFADKVLVIDSCYAGGMLALSGASPNTRVIAASRHDQEADGYVRRRMPSDRYGSVFTSWLADGLGETALGKGDDTQRGPRADANEDGKVSLGEAFSYARTRILERSLFGQEPVMSGSGELIL